MKTINSCLLLVFLFIASNTLAQKDIPSFGKVDKADLEMKQCPFDATAEAMVMFDVGEVFCFLDPQSERRPLTSQLERHVRIKILSSKGLNFANIHIPFISKENAEDIKNISAQTYNLDASGNIVVTKIDRSSIFTKKINKRYSEVVFAFPEVKAGSIIEYKYKNEADYLYAMKNWYFQRPIPVKISRYMLNFPNEFEISARPQGILQVTRKDKNEGNRYIKTFNMTEVPALRDEPYISCDEDYLQQVVPYMVSLNLPGTFTRNLLRTWPGMVKYLMQDEDFGVQLKKNIPRTKDLDVMLENVSDPYQKMKIIHNYVKTNMEWNSTYGIWALEGVKSAWKDKKGTTGEINLILVNLLKDADLEAYPLLVSTREHGRVNLSIADYDQFNKVLAYVTIGGKNYVLDATDKYTPIHLIPLNVMYSEGLVISKYDNFQWGWKPLWDDTHFFDNYSIIDAAIDEKGIMKGQVQISSADYSRLERIPVLKEGKEKFIQTYLSSEDNSLKLDSIEFDNNDIDSLPLIQSCKFSRQLTSSGGYNYFSVNLFSGLEKNPFIADSRFSDVFFGANQSHIVEGNFTIPNGYSFDALPRNLKMILPDTSIVFSRYTSVSGNRLWVKMVLEFKKPIYYAEDYDAFHEFYKKLFSLLNEQFVYKKD